MNGPLDTIPVTTSGLIPARRNSAHEYGVPYGYCQCGCGRKARVSLVNDRYFGYIKGEPKRFIRGHNSRKKRPTL